MPARPGTWPSRNNEDCFRERGESGGGRPERGKKSSWGCAAARCESGEKEKGKAMEMLVGIDGRSVSLQDL